MFNFVSRFSSTSRSYKPIGDDSAVHCGRKDASEIPTFRASPRHVAVLYVTIVLLLTTLLLSIARFHSSGPDQKTLTLHKVKFSGGIIFDENGTASVSHIPGDPDYFGPPSLELESIWENLLSERFIKVEPKDWPSEAIPLLEQDLVEGSWRLETSGFHVLHCLNYVRKSLSPEYYTRYRDQPNPDLRILSHSGHLTLTSEHCLEQIRQNLMCQLDMTPTPRTWRPAPAGKHGHGIFHADTDQWHVCRNFEAMRTWMYPLREDRTGYNRR
ncbi:hypothetical protein VTL71DRAFT_9247 [Oculimacula yallundae]|uniref:Uncharacterized protein n=1 Tax=Oculimacula yallundae TaxID=86028 RepID=A0ABR4BTR9_9HELO